MKKMLRSIAVRLITAEARLALSLHHPTIIAVTGNLGKTSAKDAIYAAISKRYHVRKSLKSFNSDVGVPLAILALENPWSNPIKWAFALVRGFVEACNPLFPKFLVLEVGADMPGDTACISAWLKPDIAVCTGVPEVPVHVEYFGSRAAVVQEKRALFEALKPGGSIVAIDDGSADEVIEGFGVRIRFYGFRALSDFVASGERVSLNGKQAPAGVAVQVKHGNISRELEVRGALGRPRVYAALAALAVADVLHIDLTTAIESLALWEPSAGRMRLIAGVHDSTILDDSYNASPAAVLSALDTLKEVPATRRIAVLGDMLELGDFSEKAHREIGEKAVASSDVLVTVGSRARGIAQAAQAAGMATERIMQYEAGTPDEVGKKLALDAKRGDVVLVKGSQSMRLERVTYELMEHKEDAEKMLVRFDSVWRNKPVGTP